MHTGDLRELAQARRATEGCSHVIHLAAIVGGIANFHRLPHTLTEVNTALYNAVVRAALEARSSASRTSPPRWSSSAPPSSRPPRRTCPTAPCRSPPTASRSSPARCTAAPRTPSTASRTPSAAPSTPTAPARCPTPSPGIAHAVPDLIRKVLSGQRPLQIFGSGEQTRTLTHVDDIADGVVVRDGLPGGVERGLQRLRLARADGRGDRAARVGGLRRGPRRVRARAPALLHRGRPAPLALGGEGPHAARLGGAHRGPGRPRRDRRLAARAGGHRDPGDLAHR